jgi:hypothetical protein
MGGKSFRDKKKKKNGLKISLMLKHLLIIVLIGLVFGISPVFAYVMSSTNYRIQSDSVNIGGLDTQSSDSYIMKDTIGEIATGESESFSYKLRAGYRQMQEVYLSISSPPDVTMTPEIGGVIGGISNGSSTWTVITDNPAGYTLTIKANTSPALQSGSNSFADYTPNVSGTPDYDWSIADTDAEFGFTPEGENIVQKFKDNGSSCNTGTLNTPDKCWYNFSTSTEVIAQSYSSNHPSGAQTTIKFRAESGTSNIQPSGIYQAVIVVTVTAN